MLLLQRNKCPSHAWTGGAARREQGLGDIGFPCIRAGDSRNDSEAKYRREENISLACMCEAHNSRSV